MLCWLSQQLLSDVTARLLGKLKPLRVTDMHPNRFVVLPIFTLLDFQGTLELLPAVYSPLLLSAFLQLLLSFYCIFIVFTDYLEGLKFAPCTLDAAGSSCRREAGVYKGRRGRDEL